MRSDNVVNPFATLKLIVSLERLPGEARSNGAFDAFAGIALIVAGIAYLYFDTFGGVIRFALPAMGLTLLAYSFVISLPASAIRNHWCRYLRRWYLPCSRLFFHLRSAERSLKSDLRSTSGCLSL
jgi:hypothetical protein